VTVIGLSVTTGYAIKALSCLESGDCSTHHISDIARCSGVPRPYLAKIINAMSRAGLVTTKRGYRGGIGLARPAAEISLLDIVEAIEGNDWIGDCLLGMDACSMMKTCPTQAFWQRIRREITGELRQTTLATVLALKRSKTNQAQNSSQSVEQIQCICA
jgi:Rrf2 family protein